MKDLRKVAMKKQISIYYSIMNNFLIEEINKMGFECIEIH
jgi:hypothetical protein|tara:strand:- start:16327 stop:16446 length:120 start_codon:yes stop_codon:yes gene_type:complete